MVNSSQPTNDSAVAAVASGGSKQQQQQRDYLRGGESSPESKQDCHNVVKSSGLGNKRRFCCEHGHRTKSLKVSVACQTDDAVGGGGNGNGNGTDANKMTTTALDSAVFCNPSEPALSAATALRISAPQTSPKQEADDCSKSEGTLRLMIHNFRNMNDTVRGPAKVVNNVPWKIMVMPRQHVVAKKGTQKCLGFFLQCFPESYSDSWSCQAAAELRLISQKPGVPNFVRKTNHVYTAKENDWGYSCFMTWADILDESQGYMKEENVILEVYVKAEPPKGILTHDQFCKKIQDYMRLADMQCSRNLIDKALEVNQTALKFCKDKDESMKEELEKQRQRLIEQKLKQSIERIEKGFTDVKSLENGETGTNLNTLRQALAGNLAAIKNAGGTTASKNATTTPASKDKATKQAKELTKTDEAKIGNLVNQQPPTTDETKVNTDGTNENEPKRQLVSDKEQKKAQQVVDMDDPEAGTSDESDDESDYEDIDEVCDSCLVEKLENMSCIGVGNDSMTTVETQENGCQTEPPVVKPRLPPIGASLDETKGKQAAPNNNNTSTTQPVQVDNQTLPAKTPNQAKTAPATPTPTPVALSNESEQKLLQLITEESKASLNTIKDTLERLVLLAQGGETLPPNVPFDLGTLKNAAATQPASKTNAVGGENVKTDIVEIPPPPPPAGKQSSDENAKMVNVHNQLVAQKRRQQQQQQQEWTEEDDDASLQKHQQQQFVQTDLSFTPRAGSPTSEDRTLLARAQAIVENKAEELVTKYSQLIEQSEANRLAETVKKVEKRMKDIEKQTMTCRKELSDECERHYREEQKLIKANKQLKQQLDQANEKIEKLNNQLKDKRVEVKKLEKRLKAESQSSAENAELNSKIEQLERDLAASRQKHSEEKQRWNEETQKFQETKRSLQQELTFTTGEVERLHTQLEEKNAAIRKLESNVKQDRQQAQSSLKEAVERAKKAEVGLLELRLEMGLKGLQRAVDECQSHVAQLEDSAKRFTRMQMTEEAKTSNSCLQEWRKTKDKIQELIQKAKNDFGQQMDAIKSGKALSSLPNLEVPRPPPPPPTPKLFLSVQTPPEQRQQHIAPIGTAAAITKGSAAMMGSNAAPSHQPPTSSTTSSNQHSSNANVVPNGNVGHGNQRAPSVPPPSAAPVSNGPTSGQGQTTPTAYHGASMSSAPTPQTPNASGTSSVMSQSTESPGGPGGPFEHLVFPQGATAPATSGGQSGNNGPGYSSSASMANVSSSSSSVSAVTSRDKTEGVATSSSGISDFTPWATDPLNIMHTLIGAKGGFNISGFDGGFNNTSMAGSTSSVGGASASGGGSGQGGSHDMMNGGFGLMSSGSGTPSGRHSQDGQQGWTSHSHHHQQQHQQHHHWTQQSPAVRTSASARSQGNGSPPQGYDTRADSPMEKRTEALMEQLRNIFPNLSHDFIRDCVYEFRHFGKNFKTMPPEQLVNSAVGFVLSRQQQGPKLSNWNSSNIQGMMGGYEGGHGTESNMGANDEMCAICGYALRLQPMCSLPPCSHVFHSACATQWLLGQRACPTCGVFALPPEEYPDLS